MSVDRYDISSVIKALRRKVVDDRGNFSWSKLGVASGRCFNTVPKVYFMNGPSGKPRLTKVVKEKKKRVRIDEEAVEENPDEILTQKKDKNGLSGMEDIIKSVSATLENTVKKRRKVMETKKLGKGKGEDEGACLVKLVVNPKSFTQTAEKILALRCVFLGW